MQLRTALHTFTTQAVQTAVQTPQSCTPEVSPAKNKDLLNGLRNEVWLSIKEAVQLTGKAKRTVVYWCETKKCVFKIENGNGGKQYRILLSSLPETAQIKYWTENLPAQPAEQIDTLGRELDMKLYMEAPEYNRRKAEKYLNLLKITDGAKGEKAERLISEWNAKNPDMKTSYRSLMRIRKDYEQNGIEALLGKYGKTRNRNLSIEELGELGVKALDFFKSLYLKQGAPSAEFCWKSTYGYALEIYAALHMGDTTNFEEVFPVAETFTRALERQIGESAIYLARYGEAAWNKKWGNFIDRDYSNIRAGDVWISDHRQIDELWIAPDGTLRRPWMTAWIDFKTQKFISWSMHFEAPNSDDVIETYVDGVSRFGVNKEIYIDNGKDYRANDFAGGRRTIKVEVDPRKTRSLTAQLGVTVHFATAYNAQSKPIERCFKIFKEWCDKNMPGYTGGNHVERPAEQLERQIAKGELMTFEEGVTALEFFIENIFEKASSEGKVLRGRSRHEAFYSEFKGLPRVSDDTLIMLTSRNSSMRTIKRNGIKAPEVDDFYYAPWMEAVKGREVYMKRLPRKMQIAYVFDARTEEFLGKAELATWKAAALASTDLEKSKLKQAIKLKKQTIRNQEALAKAPMDINAMDMLRYAALGIDHMNAEMPEFEEPESNIIQMTRYDEVARQDAEMQRTGTYDLSYLTPAEVPQTKKFKMFESEDE